MTRLPWLLPLLLVACSRGDGTAGPTPAPAPASTTAVPSAPPTAAVTPSPTAPAPGIAKVRAPFHFKTPTGNIGCYISAESVVCDIAQYTWRLPPRPSGCEYDWVASARVDAAGRASIGACASDTVLGANRVLAYDTGVATDDFQCVSTREGVTCSALVGDGFFLSKAAARVTTHR